MRRAITATTLILTILATGCASQSEVEDLEQRVAELESITESIIPDTRPLPARLVTKRSTKSCYMGTSPPIFVDIDTRATLKDGAGTTYDLTFIGEPTVDTETETCTFNFTFQQAPTDLPVYVVELEGTNGRITKTRTGLEAAGWLLKINATDPRMVDEYGWSVDVLGDKLAIRVVETPRPLGTFSPR